MKFAAILSLLISLPVLNVEAKRRPPRQRRSRRPHKHQKRPTGRPTKSPVTNNPTALPTKAPVKPTTRPSIVTPFPVNPFAVMGTTHTAIRGWILQMEEDCLATVSNFTNPTQLNKTIQSVQTLLKLINIHMQHEDDAFYIAVDNLFNGTAQKQGYRNEHVRDMEEQLILTNITNTLSMPNFTLSATHAVCAEMYQFASDHEMHMVHEEQILSPLTSKFPTGSAPAIVRYIIMTNFNTTYDFFAATALTQLVKRSSLTTVGSYVAAIKRVLTPSEYMQVLPSIINAVGSNWSALVLRGLNSTSSGTYSSADDLLLPVGAFIPFWPGF
jgi:hypothetical protein